MPVESINMTINSVRAHGLSMNGSVFSARNKLRFYVLLTQETRHKTPKCVHCTRQHYMWTTVGFPDLESGATLCKAVSIRKSCDQQCKSNCPYSLWSQNKWYGGTQIPHRSACFWGSLPQASECYNIPPLCNLSMERSDFKNNSVTARHLSFSHHSSF